MSTNYNYWRYGMRHYGTKWQVPMGQMWTILVSVRWMLLMDENFFQILFFWMKVRLVTENRFRNMENANRKSMTSQMFAVKLSSARFLFNGQKGSHFKDVWSHMELKTLSSSNLSPSVQGTGKRVLEKGHILVTKIMQALGVTCELECCDSSKLYQLLCPHVNQFSILYSKTRQCSYG